jgi:hypothetical protein
MEKIGAYFLAVFLFFAPTIHAAELYRTATYFEHTGQTVTVAWDAITNATNYIWRIKSVERQKYIAIDGNTEHETTATQFSFKVPFMGHFIVEVKALDAEGNASAWAKSDQDQYATIKGENKGWWIYGLIAPAGDIDIKKGNEKNEN